MTSEAVAREITSLVDTVLKYQYEYYVLNEPSVSDLEYDRIFDRLLSIEKEYPGLVRMDSPTQRIGSDLSNNLPEVSHSIPVLSLDKCYTYSELNTWIEKTKRNSDQTLGFVVEEKIDGVSIVLYYENGLLERAVTRGNGFSGNDVTSNIKTIHSVPLKIDYQRSLAVRGEIYLPNERFAEFNAQFEIPYANPRNLAAGTIRRKKSREAADVPLNIFIYEGYFHERFETHREILAELHRLKFRVNPSVCFFYEAGEVPTGGVTQFQEGKIDEIYSYIQKESSNRDSLPYEIDGLVVKVNEISKRDSLGFTGHHPRWAIAYKFEAPEGVSKVFDIDVQVGRTGRITPVARIKPVLIGGSTVSNVTLHNQDYIDLLELSLGDTIAVSKRGDVIPAVERVLDKSDGEEKPYIMPRTCPSCDETLQPVGAHLFCRNRQCPAQMKGRVIFFSGKGQMDIQNMGSETIEFLWENDFVRVIEDIYTFDYDRLADLHGFGPKKVQLLKIGVEESKSRPFQTVLPALGIQDLGPKVCELIIEAGYTSIEKIFAVAEEGALDDLTSIHGIGLKTAEGICEELTRADVKKQIRALQKAGLRFEAEAVSEEKGEQVFAGQVWCVTGSFNNFKPRTLAIEEIKKRGGRVVTSITSKTTHLLSGSEAGSKLKKAQEFSIAIVDEKTFLEILE
jgi:DNA ligase (NAD+)